jgi:long-chain acyl-CoA synthetase
MSDLYGILSAIKIYENDVNMAFLPFHHCFGAIGLSVVLGVGAKVVFCDGLRYIAQNLKEYKVTLFFCVPLILESMHKKIVAEIDKKGLTKKINLVKKLSRFLLKFGIDIRRKVFKAIIDNLGGSLRLVVSGAAAIDRQVVEDFNTKFDNYVLKSDYETDIAEIRDALTWKNMQ